jgi:type II secretory pathway pseudopilin PulG
MIGSLIAALAIVAIAVLVVTLKFGSTSTAELEAREEAAEQQQEAIEERIEAREEQQEN